MQYLAAKSFYALGRQEEWWSPVDIYCGVRDGKELWSTGRYEEEDPYERIEYWRPIEEDEAERIKQSEQARFEKTYGVPYRKDLTDRRLFPMTCTMPDYMKSEYYFYSYDKIK